MLRLDTSNIDYKQLKKWLRHGDIAQLAEKFQLSRSAAYKVLNGETKNFAFLQAALELAGENKARTDALMNKLNQTI